MLSLIRRFLNALCRLTNCDKDSLPVVIRDDDDVKTVLIPLRDHPSNMGMDFYQVHEAFARERLRFQRAISHGLNSEHTPIEHHEICDLGTWLRFVDYPAKESLILHLRTLHQAWHIEAERIAAIAESGNSGMANRLIRIGKFATLSRMISESLNALWAVDEQPRKAA